MIIERTELGRKMFDIKNEWFHIEDMDFPDFLSKNKLNNVREITESLRLPCETCCDWMLHWNDYFSFGCFICLVCYSERTSFKITEYVTLKGRSLRRGSHLRNSMS